MESINSASAALNSLNKSILETGDSLGAIKEGFAAFTQIGNEISKLAGGIPVIGGILGNVGNAANEAAKKFGSISAAMMGTIGMIDATGGAFRELDKSVFNSINQFGLSFSKAQEISGQLMGLGTEMASIDFGFVDPTEVKEMSLGFLRAGISLDQLNESINTGAGAFKFYQVAVMQSKAAGIETSKYIGMIEDAVRGQGLTMQEAAEQVSMFSQVSRQTGLSITEIQSSLTNTASGYAKIGVSASFARPALEGFAKTMKGMGLPIKESLDLAQGLSKSLASIPTDYSTSFLMAQRGGMGSQMGANSGVLGAGIELQARLLKAQRGEGGESQEDIAREMAMAMRDTLTSFTGGRIVTVEQAADDSSLQQAFYAQTQIMSSMFGLGEAESIRVLDLFNNLDEAMSSGDTTLANELAGQIAEGTKSQNETKTATEKFAAIANAQLTQDMVQTRLMTSQLALMGSNFAQAAGVDFETVMSTLDLGGNITAAVQAIEKNLKINPDESLLGQSVSHLNDAGEVVTQQLENFAEQFKSVFSSSDGEGSADDSSNPVKNLIVSMEKVLAPLLSKMDGLVESNNKLSSAIASQTSLDKAGGSMRGSSAAATTKP